MKINDKMMGRFDNITKTFNYHQDTGKDFPITSSRRTNTLKNRFTHIQNNNRFKFNIDII